MPLAAELIAEVPLTCTPRTAVMPKVSCWAETTPTGAETPGEGSTVATKVTAAARLDSPNNHQLAL